MANPLYIRLLHRPFARRVDIINAVSGQHFQTPGFLRNVRTSAGLYYFSAKLAPPKYSALASWITGWANVTGQIALVCSIDFTW